jgi:tetratricopeptide (TPR) repeat protein
MVRVWEASTVPFEVWQRRALVSRVHALFTELLLRDDVLAAVRKDPRLSEAGREFALRVAQTHSENASALSWAAWKLVRGRDAGPYAATAALRQVQAALRETPGDGDRLATLGVAYYRLGAYARALETLQQAEQLESGQYRLPTTLAFLAMAHQQLGHKAQAQATLARLREVMKQPRWANDAEAQGFLHEAEEPIDGKAAKKTD